MATSRLGGAGRAACATPTRAVSGFVCCVVCGAAACGQATFQSLGLPLNAVSVSARAISADGSTVVGQANIAGILSAFRWTQAGGVQPLASLANAFSGDALSVSGDGSVVVGQNLLTTGFYRGVRWSGTSSPTGLGTLDGSGSSMAYGVSTDGLVITGWSNHPDPAHNAAFRWVSPPMTALDLAAGTIAADGDAVSANGSVIVGTGYTSASLRRPVRWVGTAATDLVGTGAVPGGRDEAYARAVSADGATVLIVADNTGPSGATDLLSFRWTSAGGAVSIGTLPGFPQADARAMSSDGSTVVGIARPASGDFHPFLWTAADGMRDLLTVLGSAVPAGWSQLTPVGVSADGLAIAGTGRDASGRSEGFIVRLAAAMCYPNCDGSTSVPILNVNDFLCFQTKFAAGDSYANCDHSTIPPVLNVSDFLCFLSSFAAGCR